jgi:hypothetical protein
MFFVICVDIDNTNDNLVPPQGELADTSVWLSWPSDSYCHPKAGIALYTTMEQCQFSFPGRVYMLVYQDPVFGGKACRTFPRTVKSANSPLLTV